MREVLSEIELDPATCLEAQANVKAQSFYTIQTDSLSKDWKAKSVFLNPPYGKTGGKSNAGIWAKKLIEEFENGNIEEAILLVNASTSEGWFQPLYDYPICFTNHRIKYISGTGEKKSPTKGNAFVYLGKRKLTFAKTFDKIGKTVEEIK